MIYFQSVERKHSTLQQNYDIIELIPHLKSLTNEKIILNICENDLEDNNIIYKFAREISIMRHLNIKPIIVLDIKTKLSFWTDKIFGKNFLDLEKDLINQNLIDVLDSVINIHIARKITNAISEMGSLSVTLSGKDGNFIFAEKDDDDINILYDTNSLLNAKRLANGRAKYVNVDFLDELDKTSIIPVVIPVCNDSNGNTKILDSLSFSTFLAEKIHANKVFFTHEFDDDFFKNSIYGVSKFEKIVKQNQNNFAENSKDMLKESITCIKNGVNNVYLCNLSKVSILEEICMNNPSSLMIYNDGLYDNF